MTRLTSDHHPSACCLVVAKSQLCAWWYGPHSVVWGRFGCWGVTCDGHSWTCALARLTCSCPSWTAASCFLIYWQNMELQLVSCPTWNLEH